MQTTIRRSLAVSLTTGGLVLVGMTGQASAHPHKASTAHQGAGQVIANGQNHAPFTAVAGGMQACGGDPAAYGLETAHHGPDAGTPGNGDGCYQVTGTPATDVANPVIR